MLTRTCFLNLSAIAILAGTSLATPSLCQQASVGNMQLQDYERLQHVSTLEWLNNQPFTLKMDFQLYDLQGRPAEKGTIDETWGESHGRIVHVEAPSLKFDEPSKPESDFSTHIREAYLVRQVLNGISRPLPLIFKQDDFVADRTQQVVDGTVLNCFALVLPTERKPDDISSCTDANNRLVALTGTGPFILRRENFRKYRDREVPLDLELFYGGKMAMTAHVVELDVLPPQQESSRQGKGSRDNIFVPGGVVSGRIIKKKQPKYPGAAKAARIGGTVVLMAIITKEGTISALDVVASPDPILSKSAIDAVAKWTYTPYLLDGKPTEVDTTISVNYNLGH